MENKDHKLNFLKVCKIGPLIITEDNEHANKMIYRLWHHFTMRTTKSSCFTAVCVHHNFISHRKQIWLCENQGDDDERDDEIILSFKGGKSLDRNK